MNIVDVYKQCNGKGMYIDKTCSIQLYTDTKLEVDDCMVEEISISDEDKKIINNSYSLPKEYTKTYLYKIHTSLQYKDDLTKIIDHPRLNKNDLTILNLDLLDAKPHRLFSKDWWKDILG